MALPYPPVFAQVHAAALECPKCGAVHVFGKITHGPHNRFFRSGSQCLRCRVCHSRIYLGLLLWTDTRGPDHMPSTAVPRKVATLRALRNLGGGFWSRLGRGNAQPASLYAGEDAYCLCGGTTVSPACPIHGRQYEEPEEGETLTDHLPLDDPD